MFEGNPTRFLPEGITVHVLYLLEKIKMADVGIWCRLNPPRIPKQCYISGGNKQQLLKDNN